MKHSHNRDASFTNQLIKSDRTDSGDFFNYFYETLIYCAELINETYITYDKSLLHRQNKYTKSHIQTFILNLAR